MFPSARGNHGFLSRPFLFLLLPLSESLCLILTFPLCWPQLCSFTPPLCVSLLCALSFYFLLFHLLFLPAFLLRSLHVWFPLTLVLLFLLDSICLSYSSSRLLTYSALDFAFCLFTKVCFVCFSSFTLRSSFLFFRCLSSSITLHINLSLSI